MKNQKQNTLTHKDFTQVCVWPGTTMGSNTPQDMVDWFKEEFGIRVQFLEIIITNAGEPDSGGRSDIFFAVHKDDINKFAIPRLQIGVRWIEDVLAGCNYRKRIYPDRVFGYKTWEAKMN